MPLEDSRRLDSIDKIDLSNAAQFGQLVEYYRRNMETINFWLTYVVFPSEMQHFPYRMTATSWNLAENDGGHIGGFSGTNDNHRSLPLQVRQFFFDKAREATNSDDSSCPIWHNLMGTNGLMVDLILKHTVGCFEIGKPCELLSFVRETLAANENTGAIIDAGALFAGASNESVAREILKLLGASTRFRGVFFFENASGNRCVLEAATGRIVSPNRSTVTAQESFAFFDEPRCRGADLKLDADVVAVLTLGPRMCKDKLMQAAGRLRRLGKRQKLTIVGTSEVMDQVKTGSSATAPDALSVKDVLSWTLRNTVESNAQSLLPWATQGFFHATCYNDPDLVVEPEPASLEELYGSANGEVLATVAVSAKRHYYVRRAEAAKKKLLPSGLDVCNRITDLVDSYGVGELKLARGTDEECERELELEVELEQEEEVEVPTAKALGEKDWDVGLVLMASKVAQLPAAAGIGSLRSFVERYLSPPSLKQIAWSDKMYVTNNFALSVCDPANRIPNPLNHYVRLVDACLLFPKGGEVLVLSEREADLVVDAMWKSNDPLSGGPHGAVLFHQSLFRRASDGSVPGLPNDALTLTANPVATMTLRSSSRSARMAALSNDVLTCLQLLSGDTSFATPERRESLKLVLQVGLANDEPEHLVAMRGRSHCYEYSDLERVCDEVAREEEAERYRRAAVASASVTPAVPTEHGS